MQPEPDTSLAGKDLRCRDFRHTDLTNMVLFGADLREAQLYGAKISLLCQTFDGVKLDKHQVASLLLMLAQADIDPLVKQEIRNAAKVAVGDEDYHILLRMMRLT